MFVNIAAPLLLLSDIAAGYSILRGLSGWGQLLLAHIFDLVLSVTTSFN